MTRKRPEVPPEVVENKRELGPVPPLSPIPDELDPAKRETAGRASNGPDWPIVGGIAILAILFVLLVWYVIGR